MYNIYTQRADSSHAHVASLTSPMTASRMSRHNVHDIHFVVPAPHHNTALLHHGGGEHLAGEPHRAQHRTTPQLQQVQQARGADTADTHGPTNQGHKRGGVHWRLGVEGPQGVWFGVAAVLRSGTAAVQLVVMAAKEDERP